MRKLGIIHSILLLCLCALALKAQPVENWVAPPWTDTLKNPFQTEPAELAVGKSLFNSICFVCHGNQGKGDGVSAATLERSPANLTSPKVQSQTDGALFWKITEGNPPMLSFKESLTEEQRWKVVGYVRELVRLYPDEKTTVSHLEPKKMALNLFKDKLANRA